MNLDNLIKPTKTKETKGASALAPKIIPKSQSNPALTKPLASAKSGGLSVFPTQKSTAVSSNDPPTSTINAKTAVPPTSSIKEKPVVSKAELNLKEFLAMDDINKLLLTDKLFALDDNNSANASTLTKIVKSCGFASAEASAILKKTDEHINGGSSVMREIGLVTLMSFANEFGRSVEPFILPYFSKILEFHADRSAAVRDLAASVLNWFVLNACPCALRLFFPALLAAISEEDWRVRVGALNLIKTLSPRMSRELSPLLPLLIPKATDCIYDNKKQVQYAAIEALNEACNAITNEDIRPLVPQLVSVIAHPEESIKTLDLLLETTFVATVDSPVLALIAPLLGKSLKPGQSTLMKRKASRVIDIMCRLVQNPTDVAPFMPLLLPALDKVIDEIVDAEVCDVAKDAREILLNAFNGKSAMASSSKPNASVTLDVTSVQSNLLSALHHALPIEGFPVAILKYVAELSANLVIYGTSPNPFLPEDCSPENAWKYSVAMTQHLQWRDCILPYITPVLKFYARKSDTGESEVKTVSGEFVVTSYRTHALGSVKDNDSEDGEDESNVCDIEFSLAFGGKILLHNTRLRLGKGRRYGLMGKNGAGKTTLLTNLGSGNIEGVPSYLKMVYVQHDDASDDFGVPLIDEMMAGSDMVKAEVRRDDAVAALKVINFTDDMLCAPRSALSGGWKMKLLIVRAMLARADVLLLDEPTNHLDADSVKWLTNNILSQSEVTCLIVSHDTKFMDNVLTDVIHYEDRKLVYYHGNLTHFVEIHPEARYYYELEASTLSFKFPTPERLDGINSTTRSILKMDQVTYSYPGASKPTLIDISVKVCLGSRVAICGANGAGKSTLIKLLVQETEPDEGCGGEIWKHMNLRVAYVAQHSFHHVEQHLDSSPVDYIKWRFCGGVDREELTKPSKKLTEEEEVSKKGPRKYGDVDLVLGRRKFGRSVEYECTFIGQNPAREPNKYISLEDMIKLGHEKLVQICDAKTAAMAAGLDLRPLLTAEIQGHLNEFNLEAEFGTFGTIRRLSGGQKVKLVLAAAMWNRPHVIILDEPTNYLDRQALGALTQAIKSFAGGIVIISHNAEFTDAICTEKWLVQDGRCYTTGSIEESTVVASSSRAIKRSNSAPELEKKDEGAGNTNTSLVNEVILNPRTLEGLSKKETRKLERCAAVAGVSLKDYVGKLTCKSPEWKWL